MPSYFEKKVTSIPWQMRVSVLYYFIPHNNVGM